MHRVLESTDFATADLQAELATRLAEQRRRRDVGIGDAEGAIAGLIAAIETPLGPLLGDLRLRDVTAADRLDELSFELPLVGGDTPTGSFAVADVASLLETHLSSDDPLRGYSERLRDPLMRSTLRGYLTGTLDLVLRTRNGDGSTRYALVDYKTNWLGTDGDELSAWHYRPAALAEAMQRAHYPLQALLYLAALHRYLRARLPGYQPDRDLAGVLYLFLRGMSGAGTPRVAGQPCGVFAWRPPASLVEALSDLLDQGSRRVIPTHTVDPDDIRFVRHATGALQSFNQAGVLAAADVHVALRLRRLAGEEDESTLLAAALAVRALRFGSVCVDLASIAATAATDLESPVDLEELAWPDPESWVTSLTRSPLVAAGEDNPEDKPLRLIGTTLYLDRYWRDERLVAADLLARNNPVSDVDAAVLAGGLARLFDGEDPDLQRLAAATCVLRGLAVVGGGPGTGKTTTVTRILVLLDEQAEAAGAPPPLVALAAPTGRAAARLQEAVHQEASRLNLDESVRARLSETTGSTLHRLLGTRFGSPNRFRHGRRNQLPHDVVVVDETSMVPLSLMARLLEAVRRDARLVLVGDPKQLASVEAGAVLGDVVGPAADALLMSSSARSVVAEVTQQTVPASEPPAGVTIGDGIVVLRRVHRFSGAIAALAEAVRSGDGDAALAILRAGDDAVRWLDVDLAEPGTRDAIQHLRDATVANGRTMVAAARDGDASAAMKALNAFRILCAHRRGPYGVATWNAVVEGWLAAELDHYAEDTWYVGRPLLVTQNDYSLPLFNGDTGVIIARADDRKSAIFERQDGLVEISPNRLGAVDTVHALTIHKSQGSQADAVAVLLPDADSRILTRELLYTAVTRARESMLVCGTEAAVRAGLERPVAHASGLADRLWKPTAAATGN